MSGLDNAIRQAGEGGKRVTLGEYFSAGYWSGEGAMFSRARSDYECECNRPEHKIRKGDVYMTIVPDRLAATHGVKYRKRLHVAHVNWHVIVLDRKGSVVAEYDPK